MEDSDIKTFDRGITQNDLLNLQIINTRVTVIREFQNYYFYKYRKSKPAVHPICARMHVFYMLIRTAYLNQFELIEERTKENNKINKYIESKDFDKVELAFNLLDEFLYKKGIIKFDNKKQYDTTDIELENTMKGL